MIVKPADVRAAREFLRKRGVRGVSPRKFARAAQETGQSYRALLDFVSGVANEHSAERVRRGSGEAA